MTTPLGPVPKTLTRDEVLARIHRKDKMVTVEGYGEYRYRSLTLAEMQEITELSAVDGKQNTALLNAYVIARSFPDLFTDEHVPGLATGDAIAVVPFLSAIGAGGFEVPPATFHGAPKARIRAKSKP